MNFKFEILDFTGYAMDSSGGLVPGCLIVSFIFDRLHRTLLPESALLSYI